jgi:hypothetical protein
MQPKMPPAMMQDSAKGAQMQQWGALCAHLQARGHEALEDFAEGPADNMYATFQHPGTANNQHHIYSTQNKVHCIAMQPTRLLQ